MRALALGLVAVLGCTNTSTEGAPSGPPPEGPIAEEAPPGPPPKPEIVPEEPPAGEDSGEAPSGPVTELKMGTDKCQSDADCVPASCCHPAMCVSKDKAPTCSGQMCTMDCREGTMDCGGGCACVEGVCGANVVTQLVGG